MKTVVSRNDCLSRGATRVENFLARTFCRRQFLPVPKVPGKACECCPTGSCNLPREVQCSSEGSVGHTGVPLYGKDAMINDGMPGNRSIHVRVHGFYLFFAKDDVAYPTGNILA